MTFRAYLPLAFAAGLLAATAAGAQGQGPDLQSLHQALRLTPAQEVAWQAFAASAAPDGAEIARERSAEQLLPTLSAPRRVDLSIALARDNLQMLERRGGAMKSFYATLAPTQQAMFDRMTAPGQQR